VRLLVKNINKGGLRATARYEGVTSVPALKAFVRQACSRAFVDVRHQQTCTLGRAVMV